MLLRVDQPVIISNYRSEQLEKRRVRLKAVRRPDRSVPQSVGNACR